MITLQEFPSLIGKPIYYSSFYDKEYYIIKPIRTNKVPRKGSCHSKLGLFWFDAEIMEGIGHGSEKPHNAPGTIHSFSNSYMYHSLDELRGGIAASKANQIAFLYSVARKERIVA